MRQCPQSSQASAHELRVRIGAEDRQPACDIADDEASDDVRAEQRVSHQVSVSVFAHIPGDGVDLAAGAASAAAVST